MDVTISNDAVDVHDGSVLMRMTVRDLSEALVANMDYRVQNIGSKETALSSIHKFSTMPDFSLQIGKQMLYRLADDIGPRYELTGEPVPALENMQQKLSFPIVHPELEQILGAALKQRQQMGQVMQEEREGLYTKEQAASRLSSLKRPLYGELADAAYDLEDTCAYCVTPANPKVARGAMKLAKKKFEQVFGQIGETPDIPAIDGDKELPFAKGNLKQIEAALAVGYNALCRNHLLSKGNGKSR